MIFTNHGKVDFEGKTYEIMSDVVFLLRELIDEGVIKNKEELKEIVELATISQDEVKERAKNLIKESMKELFKDKDNPEDDFFNDVFGDLL